MVLNLQTEINAPIERCFDLARSIDFHLQSANSTGEKAIGGVASGLISLGQEVEWRAKHFGMWLKMRVRISEMNPPHYFQDSMITGPFRSFIHDHIFEPTGSGTAMKDRITFFSPVPLLGEILDLVVVGKHLERFIRERNLQLRAAAESDLWRQYLSKEVQ